MFAVAALRAKANRFSRCISIFAKHTIKARIVMRELGRLRGVGDDREGLRVRDVAGSSWFCSILGHFVQEDGYVGGRSFIFQT